LSPPDSRSMRRPEALHSRTPLSSASGAFRAPPMASGRELPAGKRGESVRGDRPDSPTTGSTMRYTLGPHDRGFSRNGSPITEISGGGACFPARRGRAPGLATPIHRGIGQAARALPGSFEKPAANTRSFFRSSQTNWRWRQGEVLSGRAICRRGPSNPRSILAGLRLFEQDSDRFYGLFRGGKRGHGGAEIIQHHGRL